LPFVFAPGRAAFAAGLGVATSRFEGAVVFFVVVGFMVILPWT
jgi:hypothetical protein